MENKSSLLSSRGARIAGYEGILGKGFDMYVRDPYEQDTNPQGILNLGTSENKLCYDIIHERLTRPGMNSLDPHLLQYSDVQGLQSFREEIAKFLTEYARAQNPLDPEHIVVMNGCCSVLASLTAVLCDSEDAYLIPTPYYGSVYPDSWLYGKVRPVHVQLDSKMSDGESHPFMLTVKKLEDAMTEATKQGIRVRALILINPHNPLGDIYPAHLLKECLDFAHRYGLHVIIDEIYMLSVYDGTFASVHSLDRLPDPERTHIIWGFSKDFAMCGFRVGTVYTQSQEVRKALNQLACFHGCAGPVQQLLSRLIWDQEWINNTFLPANRRRLLKSRSILVNGLQKLNIPVLKGFAGLFVWADFRKFLKTQTFEAEMDLWWRLIHEKVYISPGQAFYCSEPGWFRLVFSDTVNKIQLGIERLQQALGVLAGFDSEDIPTHVSGEESTSEPEMIDSDATQLKKIVVY
ncbi:1-aminocyclopropane-1-carboxylate synthase-like protein 1 [Acipenser oxyrinchus oxyrinchus]|uniref:1-aminocyclopropane-1-carboxylate synthase-like protein 1 n=1 Tax=Acipenser oxyrinchus oxyrinchus TaxID=40147 RepID=A0AAD8GE62_ACIOX|nr:1-aminocyclopropane-1-carboxylate synthase-like protein 1 [Acipenser oxyrinchus oxyrinchus]